MTNLPPVFITTYGCYSNDSGLTGEVITLAEETPN